MKEGIGRINFVLRFLSVSWLFILLAIAISNERRHTEDLIWTAVMAIPTLTGFTLAWIIDGFAGIKTPRESMRPWWYWTAAGAILLLLVSLPRV